ncbi:MAG: hypothetical protein QXJ48_01060 [Candidatus Korarchaeum sp.]
MPSVGELWKEVFCSYTKDLSRIREWADSVFKSPDESLEIARKLTRAYGRFPDAITLGFSPQVLVGALALRDNIIAVTSPEVWRGEGQGALSKALLDAFSDRVRVELAPFAPSSATPPDEVIRGLREVFGKLKEEGVKLLDISGGTQLVPIAAILAGFRSFSYAYPDGNFLSFYEFEIGGPWMESSRKVFKSVSLFDPDIAYALSDAMAEYDYLVVDREESFLVEDVSSADEWKKWLRNIFLSISLPQMLFSAKEELKGELRKHIRPLERELPNESKPHDECETLYKLCPEFMNMWFFSNMILSPKFSKEYLEELEESLCHTEELSNILNKRREKIKKLIENSDNFLILPQFGVGTHRISQIAKFVKNIVNCREKDVKILLGLNERLMDRHRCEIGKLRGELKKLKVEKIKVDVEDVMLDSDDEKLRSGSTVAFLLQDYSKELVKKLIDMGLTILVIPEVSYRCDEGGGRKVRAVAGYLSEYSGEELLEALSLKAGVVEGWSGSQESKETD